jgi:hypothetical protein
MNNNGDVASIHDIEDMILNVNAQCAKECNLMKDITGACTSKCMMDNFKRLANYFTRKYTDSCSGKPNKESFNYNPTLKEQVTEIRDTNKAYDKWGKNFEIRQCAQEKEALHFSRLQFLDSKSGAELAQMEQEHPIIAKVINLKSKLRRID